VLDGDAWKVIGGDDNRQAFADGCANQTWPLPGAVLLMPSN
jgi:hypothetical protein